MPIGALEKYSSLTANRKLHLIHDCRPINEFLDLSSLGFKLQGQSVLKIIRLS